MVEVGDRVLVESEKVGSATRSGVVTAVEDRLITVRWTLARSRSFPKRRVSAYQATNHRLKPRRAPNLPQRDGRSVTPALIAALDAFSAP
jgi:hypothetical protein